MRSALVRLALAMVLTGFVVAVPLAPRVAATTCGTHNQNFTITTNNGKVITGAMHAPYCYNPSSGGYSNGNPYLTASSSYFSIGNYWAPSIATYSNHIVFTAYKQASKTCSGATVAVNFYGQLQWYWPSTWYASGGATVVNTSNPLCGVTSANFALS